MLNRKREKRNKQKLKKVNHIDKIQEQKIINSLKEKAKSTCKKCNGRGFIGYKDTKIVAEETERIIKRIYMDCICTIRNKKYKVNINL